MKTYRILAVTTKIMRDLRNDKRTLALIFVAPIFSMFVFGLAFSGDIKDAPVIIVNNDGGAVFLTGEVSLSEMIIAHLDTDVLDIEYADTLDDGIEKVKDGEAYAVIFFPEHFTRNIYKKMESGTDQETTIGVMADKSNVNVASIILKNINTAVYAAIEEMGKEMPITIDEEAIYGGEAEFIDFFVPGIMAFVVYLLTTLLTLISFVGERTSGTLDRLLATPLTESEIVIGYAAAFGTLGTMQAALLLTVGVVVFKITIIGNVILAFVVIALLAVTCQALGILFSSLATREAQAIQFLPFIILPAFLLAGVFWPIEAIPSWLRPLSYLVPPTYAVEACRSVILRGWGLDKIWTDMTALLTFASIFLIMATQSLRRKR